MAHNERKIYVTEVAQNLGKRVFLGLENSSQMQLQKALGTGGLGGKERPGHKYIKREWKDGKWLYWYKDAQGKLVAGKEPSLKEKEVATTERRMTESKPEPKKEEPKKESGEKSIVKFNIGDNKYEMKHAGMRTGFYKNDKPINKSEFDKAHETLSYEEKLEAHGMGRKTEEKKEPEFKSEESRKRFEGEKSYGLVKNQK